jgi:hypothetical protein
VLVQSRTGSPEHFPLRLAWAPVAGRVLLIGTVTGSVFLAGCLFGGLGPPDEEPAVTGVITNVETDRTPIRILIEENPDIASDEGWDIAGEKISLWVDGTSIWVQRADGSWRGGGTDDLQVGSTARAWAHGLTDSYPPLGYAEDIAVLNTASR